MGKRYFINSTLNETIRNRDIPSLLILADKVRTVARHPEIVSSADALFKTVEEAPVMEEDRRHQLFWERVEACADILRVAIERNTAAMEDGPTPETS
jgi:hypothetical protein